MCSSTAVWQHRINMPGSQRGDSTLFITSHYSHLILNSRACYHTTSFCDLGKYPTVHLEMNEGGKRANNPSGSLLPQSCSQNHPIPVLLLKVLKVFLFFFLFFFFLTKSSSLFLPNPPYTSPTKSFWNTELQISKGLKSLPGCIYLCSTQ